MSWQSLLQAQKIRPHSTSRKEIEDLRAVVERDLQDAKIEALSADRRFATAYNAALQLAKIVLACAGYRVVGPAHHQTTFEALEIAMGPSVTSVAWSRRLSSDVALWASAASLRNYLPSSRR